MDLSVVFSIKVFLLVVLLRSPLKSRKMRLGFLWLVLAVVMLAAVGGITLEVRKHKHVYTMMVYMGTPRDYEFYVMTWVIMRSLSSKWM